MEFVIVLFCLLMPVLFGMFALISRQREVQRLLLPLVEVYDAKLPTTMFFRTAEFEVHDVTVTVRLARMYQVTFGRVSPHVVTYELTAALPTSAPDCRIRPLRFMDSVRRWVGQGLLTGENAFDDMFFVQGEDRDHLHRILDVHAQSALLSLYGGLSELVVENQKFRVRATQPVLNVAAQSLVLLQRFLGIAFAGVEFVDENVPASGPVRICSESACPVCGEPLDGKIVYCFRCQSPHHRDCWNYAGGCAIYGCGSLKSSAKQRHHRRR